MINGKAVKLIAAVSLNGVIGSNEGTIPWQGLVPSDLKRFRELTVGHPVVMGRKTWESLPQQFRPLPNRQNIVLTRKKGYLLDVRPAFVAHSIEEAARIAHTDNIWIIGGAEAYKLALPFADEIHLTRIEGNFWGEIRFPEISSKNWYECEIVNGGYPPDKIRSTYRVYSRR